MKRRATKLLLYLLAGAVINILVAWGAIVINPGPFTVRRFSSATLPFASIEWSDADPSPDLMDKLSFGWDDRSWAADAKQTNFLVSDGWTSELQADGSWVTRSGGSPAEIYSKHEYPTGWPWRTLRGKAWILPGWGTATHTSSLLVRASQAWIWTRKTGAETNWIVIPRQPLWPGFAINTLFYAAVLWLLIAAPGALRRAVRHRRGQCLACGYPIGASAVCTECGAACGPRPA